MIDFKNERLITFNQAADFLPPGMRPDYSTWWRWSSGGYRGIKLETVRVGKRRLTSVEAMQRFVAAITALEDGPTPPVKSKAIPPNESLAFLQAAGILPRQESQA